MSVTTASFNPWALFGATGRSIRMDADEAAELIESIRTSRGRRGLSIEIDVRPFTEEEIRDMLVEVRDRLDVPESEPEPYRPRADGERILSASTKDQGALPRGHQGPGVLHPGWKRRARCADERVSEYLRHDAWSEPVSEVEADAALAECQHCPVALQCRAARGNGDTGIWGGRLYV